MTPISIPQHLLIPALISLVLILVILIRLKWIFKNSKNKSIWIGIITFLVIYMIILGFALYDDFYFQWDSNKYDLNMNGIFEKKNPLLKFSIAIVKISILKLIKNLRLVL